MYSHDIVKIHYWKKYSFCMIVSLIWELKYLEACLNNCGGCGGLVPQLFVPNKQPWLWSSSLHQVFPQINNTINMQTYLHDLSWKEIGFCPRVTQNMNFTQLWNHPSISITSPLTLPFVHTNNCIPSKLIAFPSAREE